MKLTQVRLSRRDRSMLEQAKRIASTSSCRFKHGAVVVKGGRVLSVGVNSQRNDRDVYSTLPDGARQVHAEYAALRALGGDARGATVYVARVNNFGEARMSMPCSRCQTLLRLAGVKRVVYTVDMEMDL